MKINGIIIQYKAALGNLKFINHKVVQYEYAAYFIFREWIAQILNIFYIKTT